MTIIALRPKPTPSQPWIENGRPTEPFASFMQTAEQLLKLLNGSGGMTFTNAANDAAAAAAGVPVGAFYRNGSIMQIRVA